MPLPVVGLATILDWLHGECVSFALTIPMVAIPQAGKGFILDIDETLQLKLS